jgi:hypothetical protein
MTSEDKANEKSLLQVGGIKHMDIEPIDPLSCFYGHHWSEPYLCR